MQYFFNYLESIDMNFIESRIKLFIEYCEFFLSITIKFLVYL